MNSLDFAKKALQHVWAEFINHFDAGANVDLLFPKELIDFSTMDLVRNAKSIKEANQAFLYHLMNNATVKSLWKLCELLRDTARDHQRHDSLAKSLEDELKQFTVPLSSPEAVQKGGMGGDGPSSSQATTSELTNKVFSDENAASRLGIVAALDLSKGTSQPIVHTDAYLAKDPPHRKVEAAFFRLQSRLASIFNKHCDTADLKLFLRLRQKNEEWPFKELEVEDIDSMKDIRTIFGKICIDWLNTEAFIRLIDVLPDEKSHDDAKQHLEDYHKLLGFFGKCVLLSHIPKHDARLEYFCSCMFPQLRVTYDINMEDFDVSKLFKQQNFWSKTFEIPEEAFHYIKAVPTNSTLVTWALAISIEKAFKLFQRVTRVFWSLKEHLIIKVEIESDGIFQLHLKGRNLPYQLKKALQGNQNLLACTEHVSRQFLALVDYSHLQRKGTENEKMDQVSFIEKPVVKTELSPYLDIKTEPSPDVSLEPSSKRFMTETDYLAYEQLLKKKSEEEELHTGLLFKLGGKVKNWKKRTMVLTKDYRILYFKDRPEKSPQGTIHLNEGYMTFREGKQDDCKWPSSVELSHTIVLVTSRRTFFLYGESLGMVDKWRDHLNGVSKRLKQDVSEQTEALLSGNASNGNVSEEQNKPAVNAEMQKADLESTMTTVGIYATLNQEPLSPTDMKIFKTGIVGDADGKMEGSQDLYIEPASVPHSRSQDFPSTTVSNRQSSVKLPLPPTPIEDMEASGDLYEFVGDKREMIPSVDLYESLSFIPIDEQKEFAGKDVQPAGQPVSPEGPPLPPRPASLSPNATSTSSVVQTPPSDFEPRDNADDFYADMDTVVKEGSSKPTSAAPDVEQKKTALSLPRLKAALPKMESGEASQQNEPTLEASDDYETMVTSPVAKSSDEDCRYDVPSDALEQYHTSSQPGVNSVYTDMQSCAEDFQTHSNTLRQVESLIIEPETEHNPLHKTLSNENQQSWDNHVTEEGVDERKRKSDLNRIDETQTDDQQCEELYDDTLAKSKAPKRTIAAKGDYRTVSRDRVTEEVEIERSGPVSFLVESMNIPATIYTESIILDKVDPIAESERDPMVMKRTVTESRGYKTIVVDKVDQPPDVSDVKQTESNSATVSVENGSPVSEPQTISLSTVSVSESTPSVSTDEQHEPSESHPSQDTPTTPVPRPRHRKVVQHQPSTNTPAGSEDVTSKPLHNGVVQDLECNTPDETAPPNPSAPANTSITSQQTVDSNSSPAQSTETFPTPPSLIAIPTSSTTSNETITTVETRDDIIHPDQCGVLASSTNVETTAIPVVQHSSSNDDSDCTTLNPSHLPDDASTNNAGSPNQESKLPKSSPLQETTCNENPLPATHSEAQENLQAHVQSSPESTKNTHVSQETETPSKEPPRENGDLHTPTLAREESLSSNSPTLPKMKRRGSDMFKKRRAKVLQDESSLETSGVQSVTISVPSPDSAGLKLALEQEIQILKEEKAKLEQERRNLEWERKQFNLEKEAFTKEKGKK